jgi:hypothetical protein
MKTKAILTDYFKAITNVASQGAPGANHRLQEEMDAPYPEAENRSLK